MTAKQSANLQAPYLLMIGDVSRHDFAKTALGLVKWCPDRVAGQLRFDDNPLDLGLPDISLEQAVQAGIKSLVIGVAPVGGQLSERWQTVLVQAASLGLDIISGLHLRLNDIAGLTQAAEKTGAQLIEIRVPPADIPIANGKKRSGLRVLMVGTDCAVGKKYTALALTNSLQQRDINATFRATGQTGIMIAGDGIPIDAVVSDFVAGAAEIISPANDPDHWDIIEGQGSLFNPSYAGVSLGLLHGSQPDFIILCHDATRSGIGSCPELPLPSVKECIDLNIRCGQLTNPAVRCAGISVNTSALEDKEREAYLQQLSEQTGLVCVDSVINGCDAIADQLLAMASSQRDEGHE